MKIFLILQRKYDHSSYLSPWKPVPLPSTLARTILRFETR